MTMIQNGSYIVHYGAPRHSGRYPYGSGENPRAYITDKNINQLKSLQTKDALKILKAIGDPSKWESISNDLGIPKESVATAAIITTSVFDGSLDDIDQASLNNLLKDNGIENVDAAVLGEIFDEVNDMKQKPLVKVTLAIAKAVATVGKFIKQCVNTVISGVKNIFKRR